jgi:PleD family two-component response regulator
MAYRFLVVDQDADMAGSIEMMLSVLGHECHAVTDYKSLGRELRRFEPQIVFYEVQDERPRALEHLVDLRIKYADKSWLSFLLLNLPYPVPVVREWLEATCSDGVVMKPFRVTTVLRLVEERIQRMKILV